MSHHMCWVEAAAQFSRGHPGERPSAVIILEDDVCPFPYLPASQNLYHQKWHRILSLVATEAAAADPDWELMYLGRNRFGRDAPLRGATAASGLSNELVRPGFSSCAHAYALSSRGRCRGCTLPHLTRTVCTSTVPQAAYLTSVRQLTSTPPPL